MQWETFAPLAALPQITHAFSQRGAADTKAPGFPGQLLVALGLDPAAATMAEQPHGDGVGLVTRPGPPVVPRVDALVTQLRSQPLVIRCADCVAVFIVDQAAPAIGLVHSGRLGTQKNIVGRTLDVMHAAFGTRPSNCRVVLGPSIGPCHYEVDLWAAIEEQLAASGVTDVHNARCCTACHRDRYYSYRAEQGRTGRMLAVLELREL